MKSLTAWVAVLAMMAFAGPPSSTLAGVWDRQGGDPRWTLSLELASTGTFLLSSSSITEIHMSNGGVKTSRSDTTVRGVWKVEGDQLALTLDKTATADERALAARLFGAETNGAHRPTMVLGATLVLKAGVFELTFTPRARKAP